MTLYIHCVYASRREGKGVRVHIHVYASRAERVNLFLLVTGLVRPKRLHPSTSDHYACVKSGYCIFNPRRACEDYSSHSVCLSVCLSPTILTLQATRSAGLHSCTRDNSCLVLCIPCKPQRGCTHTHRHCSCGSVQLHLINKLSGIPIRAVHHILGETVVQNRNRKFSWMCTEHASLFS